MLSVDGRVWIVDPVDGAGVDERIRALGEPAGAILLLDRHRRDSDAFARRHDVPVHETPSEGLPDAPFEFRQIVRNRFWREVALWWPGPRVLVVADALGTLGYFRADEEPLGVHPILRLRPPRRALAGVEPRHVLVGHGEGVHGDGTAAALADCLSASRRRIPALAGSLLRRR